MWFPVCFCVSCRRSSVLDGDVQRPLRQSPNVARKARKEV